MRVFISWSGEPSRVVASALRDWLPDVVQSLEPWLSAADIGAGARWSGEVAQALSKAQVGIICVTPDNQHAPWLSFEAGALAKTLADTYVCPYLIQMTPADVSPGPLTQFQAKAATREGTFELVSTINGACGAEALTAERLARGFDRAWPDLESALAAVPAAQRPVARDQGEILSEVLDTVRSLARRIPEPPSPEEIAQRRLREKRNFHEYRVFRLLRHHIDGVENQRSFRVQLRKMSDQDLGLLSEFVGDGPAGDISKVPVDEILRIAGVSSASPVAPTPTKADAPIDPEA